MTSKLTAAVLALLAVAAPAAAQSARIVVINADGPLVGFNDPTPAVPVGGNPGTTVGQQALNVFQYAANRWAASLQSKQVISIIATFTPLSCSATGGVLGAAAPNWYFANVAAANGGQPLEPGTWYPAALAEKRTRVDITTAADPTDPAEIFTLFNNQLGRPAGTNGPTDPGCLVGSGWYYGLDNNQPANRIDLLSVVMHEFGHGLGVTVSPTSGSSGARGLGFPSVWERRMLDVTSGKRWIDMTNAERAASARNTGNLVWAGQQVTNVVPSVLNFRHSIAGVSPAFGPEDAIPSSFGAVINRPNSSLSGYLVAPLDSANSTLACAPYPATSNTAGNIVLIQRGTCAFTTKVKNAQDAGAIAAVIYNSAGNSGPVVATGVDATITIPSWGISRTLGLQLAASPTPPLVEFTVSPTERIGATAGFARLFAPNPFQSGSSVSHFDTTLTPSVLMEPSITSDLTTKVKNPFDLTLALLRDIGW